ncbi:LysR family transcriptional regulator [Ramlibacter sp. G-1-2-2]|uniref:LysR family transcriptional regulator n=1 Tax=Ramlibacter agri TaxID=2728837 RepID=A0A848H898_9BURK|nr:LysR family transcriptional regulator [Ramlibacter agri]NML46734.1 LysR family transcriptional regulator [Ramlibacter agri]
MREAHLRDFIAVADTGSVRAAARRLKLTQGAVSKNLQALERDFGVALLHRTTRGVEPTEAGRVLLRRARAADGEMRKAREEIDLLVGQAPEAVHVGLSPTAEALLMAPAIQKFRKQYPETEVEVSGGTVHALMVRLREGALDVAVASLGQAAADAGVEAERLLSTDFVVVARDGHPLAKARDISELAGCEWVHGTRHEFGPALVEAFRKARLPPPRFAVQRDSFSALLFLLMQSDYLALATEKAVAPFCRPGLLARVNLATKPGTTVLSLLTPASRPLTPQAQALADELRRAARRHRR